MLMIEDMSFSVNEILISPRYTYHLTESRVIPNILIYALMTCTYFQLLHLEL